MKTKILRKKSRGMALVIGIFISIVGALLTISMMTLSSSNTRQIVNDQSGKAAYYAAESGFAEVKDFYGASFLNWGSTLADSGLPSQTNPKVLPNGASYWVSNINYVDSNEAAVIDIMGTSGNAKRKIRTKIVSTIPNYFDNYGLLTNGAITINGKKTLEMSIHGNEGLTLKGPTTLEDGVVATQSSDPTAGDPSTDPIGGYIPAIEVPEVPIGDLRILAQTGLNLSSTQADLKTQILNAPENSYIYINNGVPLTLAGNMQGKIIFVDGNTTINVSGSPALSNLVVVSSGTLTINGSIDVDTSHDGEIDAVFASNGNITLNGSRTFKSLFWTNGNFTQNGSSKSGRVITQKGITFNGEYLLTLTNKLYDFGIFDKIITVSSWQQIPADS